jgi:hypothetical protein
MQACYAACDLSEVHLAYSCLDKLLARPRTCEEDDADTCDGVAALIRLINESLSRREEAAMAALQTMHEVIERERKLSLGA